MPSPYSFMTPKVIVIGQWCKLRAWGLFSSGFQTCSFPSSTVTNGSLYLCRAIIAAKLNASIRLPSLLINDSSHYISHANLPFRMQRDWLSRALNNQKENWVLWAENCSFEDFTDLSCKITSFLFRIALVCILHKSEVDNKLQFAIWRTICAWFYDFWGQFRINYSLS